MEMHCAHFGVSGLRKMNIQRLTLINESSPVGRHFQNMFLLYFPHCLVQLPDVRWDFLYSLQTTHSLMQAGWRTILCIAVKTTIGYSENSFSVLDLELARKLYYNSQKVENADVDAIREVWHCNFQYSLRPIEALYRETVFSILS